VIKVKTVEQAVKKVKAVLKKDKFKLNQDRALWYGQRRP